MFAVVSFDVYVCGSELAAFQQCISTKRLLVQQYLGLMTQQLVCEKAKTRESFRSLGRKLGLAVLLDRQELIADLLWTTWCCWNTVSFFALFRVLFEISCEYFTSKNTTKSYHEMDTIMI
jgi:hypothetical protein